MFIAEQRNNCPIRQKRKTLAPWDFLPWASGWLDEIRVEEERWWELSERKRKFS